MGEPEATMRRRILIALAARPFAGSMIRYHSRESLDCVNRPRTILRALRSLTVALSFRGRSFRVPSGRWGLASGRRRPAAAAGWVDADLYIRAFL